MALARSMGYATALVEPAFPSSKRYVNDDGITVIPCVSQTRKGTTCADCRLCFDADRLVKINASIGFEVHGARKAEGLKMVQNKRAMAVA